MVLHKFIITMDGYIALPSLNRSLQSYYKDDNQWQVLPDKDFYQSLEAEGAEAYEAIDTDTSVWAVPSLPFILPSTEANFRSSM